MYFPVDLWMSSSLLLFLSKNVHSQFLALKLSDKDIAVIGETLKETNLSINNVHIFIKSTKDTLEDQLKRSNLKIPALKDLDVHHRLDDIRRAALGCDSKCPCCGKICDEDHFGIPEKIGTGTNTHKCTFGHQYRGMKGLSVKGNNTASMRFCEDMKDQEKIQCHNDIITCKEFKAKNCEWTFLDKNNKSDEDIHKSTGKYIEIWKRVGQKVCDHYRIKYTEKHVQGEGESYHFIFALDSSGSMSGAPWNALIKAMENFYKVREETHSGTDYVSIVVFETNAKILFFNQKRSVNQLECLKKHKPDGGTCYGKSLAKITEVLSQSHQADRGNFIIFMSDGAPCDSAYEYEKQALKSHKNKISKMWFIGLGHGNYNALEGLARDFQGSYKNPQDLIELSEPFIEIARMS